MPEQLTEQEAAAVLAACWAQCRGEVIDAVGLPLELGAAMLKLGRMAGGARPTVSRRGAVEDVLSGLAGNGRRQERAHE